MQIVGRGYPCDTRYTGIHFRLVFYELSLRTYLLNVYAYNDLQFVMKRKGFEEECLFFKILKMVLNGLRSMKSLSPSFNCRTLSVIITHIILTIKGSFINDVTLIWTFYDPLPPLSHSITKIVTSPKKMSKSHTHSPPPHRNQKFKIRCHEC